MKEFLEETQIIDFKNEEVFSLAHELAKDCTTDEEIAKNCFIYVRDNINHSGDFKDEITTCKASDVLKYKTGWCYAKSHLLAALLRANNIPTGFCYQRLSCSEYKKDIYCLHALNAIYLKNYGWYKVDARGNKKGVNAQFTPPLEQLAFKLEKNEFDLAEIYSKPLDVVIDSLSKNKTYGEMINVFPDISFLIINYDKKYLKQIVELFISTVHNINKKDYSKEQLNAWANPQYDLNSWEKRFEKSKPYLCMIEDKIVGFCEYYDGYIDCFYVHFKYQNCGIGKLLLNHILKLAKNKNIDKIEADVSITAKPFFEKFGFKQIKENVVKRENIELVNFSMEMNLKT
ncbi:GNAT family N-acetyltransferase [Aliarcobacter butzleri]|uniref:GNAT family N-acetyltransferase n=1 Tax=Aliarcobacter butzleri TaxID=28197 RepID=A0AAP4PWP3_9BACT|nr:GNAT family N-acetyltransferase [Aliarcobacter butzleri]MCG3682614.1 GNAT family N-acetyltransferase [Aliarcobacter butzleri]MCG3703294.1 GNAT family N-acetyltransferase [Aliarcobacter butzleri]MDN5051053.1 GNAT family N-acetyltransferase [Aliarcobacter butzleri]MDN5074380.1 GNAT family N-acetyltransferase [Aliarcobacter butzleri]MDN5115545.1 GNAT family N-acetyltransferase [Aliarcobacter butzleri]